MLRTSMLLLAALALAACSFPHDPDGARYQCASAKDCGQGYSCVPQAFGETGFCFANGECTPEVCDGADDDCDGVVDDADGGCDAGSLDAGSNLDAGCVPDGGCEP